MTSPNKPEPDPVHNDSRPIWELVVEDMNERNAEGVKKYGTPLQAHNGRDPLVDAYQEALDLAVYLRQAIEERKSPEPLKVDWGTFSGLSEKHQNEWQTECADSNGGTVFDCLGLRLSVIGSGGERGVALYMDTPEFPVADAPTTFDTITVHFSPNRVRKIAAALLTAADTCEGKDA